MYGFHWSKIKEHIKTAQQKLDTEDDATFRERYAPWDTHRGAFLEVGGGSGVEVVELLAQTERNRWIGAVSVSAFSYAIKSRGRRRR